MKSHPLVFALGIALAACGWFVYWASTDARAPKEIVSPAAPKQVEQQGSKLQASPVGVMEARAQDRPVEELPPRVAASPSTSLADLTVKESDLMQYFIRMLKNAGKEPIPADARIADAEVRAFLDAVALSRKAVDESDRTWNVAVNARTDQAVKEITDCLSAGRIPPYQVLTPGSRLPNAKGFNKAGIHIPAGSTNRYVIDLPETMFPKEVEELRNAIRLQAELFDSALRPLFTY